MSLDPKYLFDLPHQLGFYGAYHAKKYNILVHVIFVPLIFWSGQVFLTTWFPAPAFLDQYSQNLGTIAGVPLRFELGGGAWLALLYSAYYATLDPVALTSYIPFQIVPMLLSSNGIARTAGGMRIATQLHAASWVAQFLSHFLIEGRAPALLDNLLGALVLAPFFTWLEMLFYFFNYRPDLKHQIQNEAGKRIVAMNKEKRAKLEAKEKAKEKAA